MCKNCIKPCPDVCISDIQSITYDSVTMTAKKIKTIRLSLEQERLLVKLGKKLALDATNVIRVAIQRLAESEGIK